MEKIPKRGPESAEVAEDMPQGVPEISGVASVEDIPPMYHGSRGGSVYEVGRTQPYQEPMGPYRIDDSAGRKPVDGFWTTTDLGYAQRWAGEQEQRIAPVRMFSARWGGEKPPRVLVAELPAPEELRAFLRENYGLSGGLVDDPETTAEELVDLAKEKWREETEWKSEKAVDPRIGYDGLVWGVNQGGHKGGAQFWFDPLQIELEPLD